MSAHRGRRGAGGGSSSGQLREATEALLQLRDAASVSGTRGGFRYVANPQPAADDSRTPAPHKVDVEAMRKMGAALAKPMPGRPSKVSAAAARSRSTTKKSVKKPGANSTEQAAHLRREGPGQSPSPKPQR
ncbi:hypothetical protein ACF1BN_22100 [Streptomyces sp. NPDC014861]|uniref:hypothetical protein n=1 Tax=Streptomyces sp. NPDC014861 TaxID=3364923 RepID=UPI0036F50D15